MNVGNAAGEDKQARLMRDMIHRLDVDLLELAYDRLGMTYERARETCKACVSEAACAAWLAGKEARAPDFCPNLSTFRRFRRS